jgi:hypothetical protein
LIDFDKGVPDGSRWQLVTASIPPSLPRSLRYPELSQANHRNIFFVTIGRRGTAIHRNLDQQPASAWKPVLIDIPKRCRTPARYIETTLRLRGYDGPLRQVAVADLGRERPTLLLSNNSKETPRKLIIRGRG